MSTETLQQLLIPLLSPLQYIHKQGTHKFTNGQLNACSNYLVHCIPVRRSRLDSLENYHTFLASRYIDRLHIAICSYHSL